MKMKTIAIIIVVLIASLAAADVLITNGLTHVFSAGPGSVLSGRINLQNTSAEPARVRFYIRDYFFDYTGWTGYGEPGELERSNADWLELQAPEITVPASAETSFNFSIVVPEDQDFRGTFWSVIMVEPTIIYDDEDSPGVTVRTMTRYAIQIVTNFGEAVENNVSIVGRGLSDKEGIRTLFLDIQNTGDWLLRPAVSARVFDSAGAMIGEFEGESFRLYPGTSRRFNVVLNELSPGNYTVLALIRDGDEVWGAQYSMSIE